MGEVNKVAAGIVAYNPTDSLVDLCRQLIAQGCAVLVHDNGSADGQSALTACAELGAQVHRAEDNSGVAGGLQALFERTRDDFDWLLTFDQDSRIEDGYVASLTNSPALSNRRVAIVAPRVIENATGQIVQGRPEATSWHQLDRVITSGALCRLRALAEVAGFRPDLFIDYVDYDLCLRLRASDWLVVVEPAAVLHHSIGSQSVHRLLGLIPITTSNHSADRQFYKYRNYVLLTRDGTLWLDARWALLDGLALLWGPAKIILFEDHKRAKLRAIGQGVVRGFRGRTGTRNDS
jgi:rhamnosyltransferase